MASSPADLAQATDTFAAEETALQQLITQAVDGDTNARTNLLPAEIQNALAIRSSVLSSVPDADTSGIDAIISNARNVAGAAAGVPAPASTPAMFSRAGVKLGPIIVPWVGVAAIALFVGAAVFLGRPRKR